ncbi:hypothetical protein FRB90_009283 [Tulasnella sp. 427]|nr:hypothetical protein FRB90_009283 [Tulasnella sp. 427]
MALCFGSNYIIPLQQPALEDANMSNRYPDSLPAELQLQIMFCLTPSSIRNLIVNRALRPICEQALNESILITKHSKRSIRLLETFLARPDLALLVRNLSIELSWLQTFNQAQVPSPLQPNPLHALSLAKNLKYFAPHGVARWIWEPTMSEFREVVLGMKLTRLEIPLLWDPKTIDDCEDFDSEDEEEKEWDGDLEQELRRLFQYQPRLKELVLPTHHLSRETMDSLRTNLKESDIPSLKLVEAAPYEAPTFLSVAPRLERLSLTIGDWNKAVLSAVEAASKSIRLSIRVEVAYETLHSSKPGIFDMETQTINAFKAACPALQTLVDPMQRFWTFGRQHENPGRSCAHLVGKLRPEYYGHRRDLPALGRNLTTSTIRSSTHRVHQNRLASRGTPSLAPSSPPLKPRESHSRRNFASTSSTYFTSTRSKFGPHEEMGGDASAASKVNTSERLNALRDLMSNPDHNVDAYVIPSEDQHSSEYLADCDARRAFISGFTGSAGCAVITKNEAFMFTDGRYFLQAAEQMDSNWTLMKQGLPDVPTWQDFLHKNLPNNSRIGIDPQLILAADAKTIKEQLAPKTSQLVSIPTNLVDLVWASNRPSRPENQVFHLPVEYSGQTSKEKIAGIRKELKDKHAGGEALVVNMLDEVAWLFNLRGSDIAYNPGSTAKELLSASHLPPDVEIRPYDSIFEDLTKLSAELKPQGKKILISNKASLAVEDALLAGAGEGGDVVKVVRSPVTDAKAIKNPTEVEGFRNCHLRDGAALARYFAWLEEQLDKGVELTESSAADQLELYRSENDLFKGLSFPTISSTGPNCAIIHYQPDPESSAVVKKDQMYLCDSGAQYLDGTTDTTRTWHFGEPTAEEKRAFTRVLQGHISIDTAIVPNGTTDYRHGTGHGVGHFLNVHEGPQGIGMRPTLNDTPLKKGMTVSNEPGYYADGRFGIRIEDIVIVQEASTPNNFGDKGYLSFEHVTMCPKQTKLVDPSLLSPWEVKWLDDYHQEVLEKVKPILEEFKDERAIKWLERECRPLKGGGKLVAQKAPSHRGLTSLSCILLTRILFLVAAQMSNITEQLSAAVDINPNVRSALFVAASVVALFKLTGHVLRKYIIIPKTTILKDIDVLNRPRKDGKIPGKVVICGGSIGGLLAAAVCADHFESVIIVEADPWTNEHGTNIPDTEDRVYRTTSNGYQTVTPPRTRIMQYYFGNYQVFQPIVYRTFTRLFPGLPFVIEDLNIKNTIVGANLRMCYGGVDLKDPYADGGDTLGVSTTACLSREGTEAVLRKAVKESRSNISFKTGLVTGFIGDGERLAGVTVRVDGSEEQVKADFVIDATGPSQMSFSKWLANAGFSLPSELRIEYDPVIRYTASTWIIPKHLHSKWPVPWGLKCGLIYTMSADAETGDPKCIGFAMAENNQMLITLGGCDVSDLPHSPVELRSYAKSLHGTKSVPEWIWQLFDFMEEYEEECMPFWVDYRIPPMSWVQWHKIANEGTLPKNWIAVGDANMVLNPLYAQGIYKTCVDATTLDSILRSIPSSASKLPNLSALFYKKQNPRVSSLW